jgi:hypothetical protein
VLIAVSAITYALQQPDPTDPAFLSPTSEAPVGGARLARMLKDHGIDVQPVTKTSDALVAAYHGGATLFIPAPGLVHPYYLRMLKLLPATTQVVLVAPSGRALADGHLPIGVADQRWASEAAEPGCTLPAAGSAGRAAALRLRFTGTDPSFLTAYRCYAGGLVGVDWHATRLHLVGATDPFRNDRIGEYGNAKLAVGLLSVAPRVVWLDLHRREPRPGYVNSTPTGGPAPPSLGPGQPDPDFPIGDTGDDPGTGPPQPGTGDGDDTASGSNPLLSAFPSSWYATAILLVVAALLLAFAMARRLGPPVREPLPVTVRSSETVEGRGRLYARARARGPAVATLRAAALQRLIRLLDLPSDADRATVSAAAASAAGRAVDEVDDILYGPEPEDDESLVRAATRLESLLYDVSGAGQNTPSEGELP